MVPFAIQRPATSLEYKFRCWKGLNIMKMVLGVKAKP